ncbi:MAG: hypothetical protein AAF531_19565, partial [Actinomycetota bacterium]
GSVPDALDDLPDRVHGVIAAHMLGHLDRRDRAGLLQWIAGSLVPGCSALLTVSPEVAAADDKPAIEERTVGRLHYRVTHLPADHGRYDGLFEVLDREHRVVRSLPDSGSWQAVPSGEISAALDGYPVTIVEPLPGVVLLTSTAQTQPRSSS